MQREIGGEIHLGATVSPFDKVGRSSAIDRTSKKKKRNKEKEKKKKTGSSKILENVTVTLPSTSLESWSTRNGIPRNAQRSRH